MCMRSPAFASRGMYRNDCEHSCSCCSLWGAPSCHAQRCQNIHVMAVTWLGSRQPGHAFALQCEQLGRLAGSDARQGAILDRNERRMVTTGRASERAGVQDGMAGWSRREDGQLGGVRPSGAQRQQQPGCCARRVCCLASRCWQPRWHPRRRAAWRCRQGSGCWRRRPSAWRGGRLRRRQTPEQTAALGGWPG